MSLVGQRMTNLWRQRTSTPTPSRPSPIQYPDSGMFVTIREPMKISGTVLLPDRYVFRLLDPGTESNIVQIFNKDQTRLIATINPLSNK
jgi:hypothetical protein